MTDGTKLSSDSSSAVLKVADLSALLAERRPPVVLDVRWVVGSPPLLNDYLSAHIPGAQFCDLDADLADPPGPGGRHPLPDPVRLAARVRDWGIEDGDSIVVYDGGSSIAAARAWWVLRWAGLADVRVLDGGFAAWTEVDQPVESGSVAAPEPGSATLRPGALPSLTAEEAARHAAAGALVDVRTAERFRGEVEPIDPVAGHIPGAVNLPAAENLTAAGLFKPAAQLRALFADAGVDGAFGVYCGSGVTAAQTVLAAEVAGLTAVLYPGSWSEWITDPERPIETG